MHLADLLALLEQDASSKAAVSCRVLEFPAGQVLEGCHCQGIPHYGAACIFSTRLAALLCALHNGVQCWRRRLASLVIYASGAVCTY